MENDKRYTHDLEYCGYSVPLHVVRFCGDRIGAARNEIKAQHIIEKHMKERDKILMTDPITKLEIDNYQLIETLDKALIACEMALTQFEQMEKMLRDDPDFMEAYQALRDIREIESKEVGQ